MIEFAVTIKVPALERLEYEQIEYDLTYVLPETSRRLEKCNGCLTPLVALVLGDLLQKEGSSNENATLKITPSEFADRALEAAKDFGKAMGDIYKGRKHPAPVVFSQFFSDVFHALNKSWDGSDDFGGLMEQGLLTGKVPKTMDHITKLLADEAAQKKLLGLAKKLYKDNIKCGELPELPWLPPSLVSSLMPATKPLDEVDDDACIPDPDKMVTALKQQYRSLGCRDYIDQTGCYQDGSILSVEELVQACPQSWSNACLHAKLPWDETSRIIDHVAGIKQHLQAFECVATDHSKPRTGGSVVVTTGMPVALVFLVTAIATVGI